MLLTIDSKLHFDSRNLPADLLQEVRSHLTIENPAWVTNNKYGHWNKEPRFLTYFTEIDKRYSVPRGYIAHFLRTLMKWGVPYEIEDRTVRSPAEMAFQGILHPDQELASKDMLSRRQGLIVLPTGAGKTVLACHVMAKLKQKTLILLHNKELLYQWKSRIETFLGLKDEEIGLVGDGKSTIGTKVTISIVNSAVKRLEQLNGAFGLVICDECHRCPARTFTQVLNSLNPYYIYGLSATPYRADKLNRVIYLHVGDKLHEVKPEQLIQENRIAQATLIVHATDFKSDLPSDEYQEIVTNLINDYNRTWLVIGNIIENVRDNDGICLVISDRVWHAENIRTILAGQGVRASLLVGQMSKGKRKKTHEMLTSGDAKVLVATSQLIGEGYDLPELSSIHITVPMKFHGRVIQAIGRILRVKENKRAVIHDYVDWHVGIFKASFKNRLYAYQTMGVMIPNMPFVV